MSKQSTLMQQIDARDTALCCASMSSVQAWARGHGIVLSKQHPVPRKRRKSELVALILRKEYGDALYERFIDWSLGFGN